ncbi:MAG: N-acetyltransferase [Candidatus Omnitrophota bacterium]|jgi:RimJ/RimL family protein N-acetyltransferase|nr:MAG: N-acetyltransferase [Candidatus Omnitrophota bacterium]
MICGENIVLRAVEDRDLELLRKWRNHPDLMPYHFCPLPVTEMGQRRWYEKQCSDTRNVVLIVANKEQVAVGYTLIKEIDHKNRLAEIGIHLDPAFHGKGYGKDAFLTLMRYCFHELNLHRIFLLVFAFNERAIHLYQRLGFKEDGRMREAYFSQNRYHDVVVMSMLENEFVAIQSD